ncbi:MAG: hypothetical protein HYS17_02210 [Micavibrio aeruginosavorus]|uniref:Uncharacterized protein n=1 Tax=Micavibrio aeruginosavorus TaxID=349221 RepID=A0A7T5R321_9BACT|nr:MAG: hypothetical protein HYS17_02210 [Micavibrio aeruginosavorus]
MKILNGPHEIKEYDYTRIVGIIEALVYLKGEAKKTGNEDIEILIQSTFNIIITTYCLVLRNGCLDESDKDSQRETYMTLVHTT